MITGPRPRYPGAWRGRRGLRCPDGSPTLRQPRPPAPEFGEGLRRYDGYRQEAGRPPGRAPRAGAQGHRAAYSRENLDLWQQELGRELPGGSFGENLTTVGLDVDHALIGERWRIGEQVLLEVAVPRVPCSTFAAWLAEQRWVKRFTARALPGAYLRILEPGEIRAGDTVTVEHRPAHEVTVELCFRALTTDAGLLPRLVDIAELPDEVRELARRRTGTTPPYAAED
ncbi:MOSC domain-containing protein [Kitasatospora atroaurantiaca]|uniref:MOSC domain-containing protein n=1 Tax=Kitasatospora atroaurantiaca TaxID=285545 RepID=A0A561ENJ2_9ACTN|nr:MOSC domain-containing protein [Kitasatospora atroaurantiaca]